jgi:hypothetical protein
MFRNCLLDNAAEVGTIVGFAMAAEGGSCSNNSWLRAKRLSKDSHSAHGVVSLWRHERAERLTSLKIPRKLGYVNMNNSRIEFIESEPPRLRGAKKIGKKKI